MRRTAALLVHAYTASGIVLALLMIHYAYLHDVRTVLWLFLAAMVVDGTDGMLARRVGVKDALPGFDGALLDNIVDFTTYAFAPMVLLWANGFVTNAVIASVPLLASCVQFCRTDAKTEDHFFLGFPSYWNIVAFYAVAMGWSTVATAVVLLVCAALVFVPIKYVYPSRTETMWQVTLAFTAVWFVLYAVITATLPHPAGWALGLSAAYPIYYLALSLRLTFGVKASAA